MPAVVIRVDPERRSWWKATLQDQLPGFDVYLWDEDEFDKSAIDYAVVWMPPLGALASMPNLRCVFSVGAGVQHILRDDSFPKEVPIVRTVSEDLRKRMSEYIALHVLRFHRRLPEIEAAHRAASWTQFVEPLAREVPVGMLGVGNLGAPAAALLSQIGYPVQGWSRRGRPTEGIDVHSGETGLHTVLASSRIVVCLLPGTPATENLLNAERLALMPEGSFLINVGRGECLDTAALVQALESGHIAGATLDVFREEPVQSQDPLWQVPNLLITSHTASAIEPKTGGAVIGGNIRAFDAGETLSETVDIDQGY